MIHPPKQDESQSGSKGNPAIQVFPETLYPHSGRIVPQFAGELAVLGFHHSDGAIRFTPARLLPDDLVRRLVAARVAEIDAA